MYLPNSVNDNISQNPLFFPTGTNGEPTLTPENGSEAPEHIVKCDGFYSESSDVPQVNPVSTWCQPKKKKGGSLKRAPLSIYKGASHLGTAMAKKDEEMEADNDSTMYEQGLIDDDEMNDENYNAIEQEFIGRYGDMDLDNDIFGHTNPTDSEYFLYFGKKQGLLTRAQTLDETNDNSFSRNDNGINFPGRKYSYTPGEKTLDRITTKTTYQNLDNTLYDNEGNFILDNNTDTDIMMNSQTQTRTQSAPVMNSIQKESSYKDPYEITQSEGNGFNIWQNDHNNNGGNIPEQISVDAFNLSSSQGKVDTRNSNNPISKAPKYTRLQSDPGVTEDPESVALTRTQRSNSLFSNLKEALGSIFESQKHVEDSAEFQELMEDGGDDEDE